MTDTKYSRFGKYLILDHLVDGGMAKICRASYLGEQANKIVAIKMVQPRYSKNPSFVQMFEDELKVTFGLVHPNIAQVFDYGMVNEQLYSAMEYVDGANLKQYLDRLKEMKFVFPVEISTYIISQVSQALHYAHTFTDKLTGKPFNIIHRDISPHNIMLTYDGAVKVIDFGIAKADSNSEATQAGTIKGKLSYLAPEYLEGLELDHRYDQFAVGITLWEMLCSRKLFTAKNDLAVLKQIQNCKVPRPSSINPNVPPELDEIVLRALSKDRTKRFENMDKLNRALVKFLYSNYPEFNATDLSYFAKQLFKKEIGEDKKKFVEFGKIDIRPYLDQLNSEGESSKDNRPSKASVDGEAKKAKERVFDLGTFDEDDETSFNLDLEVSDKTATLQRTKKTSKSQMQVKQQSDTPASTKRVKIAKTNRTKIQKSNTNSGTRINTRRSAAPKATDRSGGKILPMIVAAGLAAVIFVNLDKFTKKDQIKGPGPASCQGVDCERYANDDLAIPGNGFGTLIFNNLHPEMVVLLNGKEIRFEAGLLSTDIKFNTRYSLQVTRPGYKKWKYPQSIFLQEGENATQVEIPELERDQVGFLATSNNFPAGSKIRFEVYGDIVEKDLPLRGERVPAGTYEAVIFNNLIQTERKVRFTINENKRTTLK